MTEKVTKEEFALTRALEKFIRTPGFKTEAGIRRLALDIIAQLDAAGFKIVPK